MTPLVDQNAVMAALQTVNDPELHRSIVSMNMIQNLAIDGGTVRFDVVLTTPACPLRATIDADVVHVAAAVGGRIATITVAENDHVARGDLLFQIVSQRYQQRSIVLTTNRAFSEWNQVFPNAACVVALIDRLTHKAEITQIEGESYRPRLKPHLAKETKERTRS